MAKPPTSVRSIRLPDDVWTALSAEAALQGESVNALVSDAVRVALDRAEDAPPLSLAQLKHAVAVMAPGRTVRVVGGSNPKYEPLRMPRAPVGSRLKKR